MYVLPYANLYNNIMHYCASHMVTFYDVTLPMHLITIIIPIFKM